MWLPLLGCLVIIRQYSSNTAGFDPAIVASTFLGIFLLGCLFISLGCCASALTRSQVTAAMLSLGFWRQPVPAGRPGGPDPGPGDLAKDKCWLRSPFSSRCTTSRAGLSTPEAVVLYLSACFFFLFLTLRVVESRRWK